MTNTLSSCHLVPSTPYSSSSHALLRRRLPLAPHITTNRHGSQTLRCAAAQRSSPSAVRRSARKGKNKREDVKLVEEEVYNIDEGWKIELDSTEKMMEIAGVQVPVRLRQQLEEERAQRNMPQTVVQDAPRLTHKLLRVMAGKAGGRKLVSPADMNVRPMMEVVRGAVFNILQALGGCSASLPSGRWLDLYSGTGSVGIEALSRGCVAAHFVEMDPWVVAQVLDANLSSTGFQGQAVVHTTRVEVLLQQAVNHGSELLGGKFDYISVTPPYESVDFVALMKQLSVSPLLGEQTCIVVEYPIKSRLEMPDSCGPLVKIRDRRYGRTHVAIYGPAWAQDG
jgi:16S rRNA (guanine(966)-N(2))-methyltransferase RsmD